MSDEELSAEVERLRRTVQAVEALFSGGPDTSCRTVWQDGVECVSVPLADLQAALAAAAAAPQPADPPTCSHGRTQAHYALATGGYCHGPASPAKCEHGLTEPHHWTWADQRFDCFGPSPAVLPDTEPPGGHG